MLYNGSLRKFERYSNCDGREQDYERVPYLIYDSYYKYYIQKYRVEEIAQEIAQKIYYKKTIYPIIKGSCKTKSCIALMAGDYLKFSKLFEEKLNIPFKIVLISNSAEYKSSSVSIESSWKAKKVNGDYKDYFKRIDYPEDLPISE